MESVTETPLDQVAHRLNASIQNHGELGEAVEELRSTQSLFDQHEVDAIENAYEVATEERNSEIDSFKDAYREAQEHMEALRVTADRRASFIKRHERSLRRAGVMESLAATQAKFEATLRKLEAYSAE